MGAHAARQDSPFGPVPLADHLSLAEPGRVRITRPLAGPVAGRNEVLIVAQGGDICRLDPVDGSPTGAALCAKVPL